MNLRFSPSRLHPPNCPPLPSLDDFQNTALGTLSVWGVGFLFLHGLQQELWAFPLWELKVPHLIGAWAVEKILGQSTSPSPKRRLEMLETRPLWRRTIGLHQKGFWFNTSLLFSGMIRWRRNWHLINTSYVVRTPSFYFLKTPVG